MNSLTFQNWDAYTLQDNDGFLNETNYQTQDNAQNKRKQLQSQISQTRDFINNTVKPAVDTCEAQTIVSADSNLTVTKEGTVTTLRVTVSPSGEATKSYVDAQDLVVKDYADSQDLLVKAYVDQQDNLIKNTTLDGKTVLCLTESEYEALATKSATTLYFVYAD